MLLFLLVHLAGACGTDRGGQVGAGGGGQAGGGAGGQAGGGGAPVTQVPNCLQALFADCPTEGVCHSSAASVGQTAHYCYANGTQADYARTGGCGGDGRTVLEVRKPDGSPCYTNEIAHGTLCEGETFTWKDPSGRVIATGSSTYVNVGMMFRCANDGAPVDCAGVSQCTLGSSWASAGCQPDGCP